MKKMKRKILHLAGLLLLTVVAAACTPGHERPRTDLRTADGKPVSEQVLGVYRLYPDSVGPAPEVPQGYVPCYVSHYGRHGSRYLLADSQYLYVHGQLTKALARGGLTRLGRRIQADLERLLPQFEGHAGDLTPVGVAQQEAIARRMVARNGEVFRPGAAVEVSTSATPRTRESMEAFCGALRQICPSLRIACREDAALNPYSSASGIPNADDLRLKSLQADWRPAFDRYCRERIDTAAFAARIFTDPRPADPDYDPVAFERSVYNLAIHFAGCGIDIDWFPLFTSDELTALSQCEAYTFYQEKGPGHETSDRTWALSAYILDRMIDQADSALVAGTAAHLRFGHDGCLMALLTLMGAEGWTSVAATADETARAWDISQIPMAGNLQWIFYRSTDTEGEILVRLLLNEEPLPLPVTDRSGLCRWQTLRDYLDGRCREAFTLLKES